MTETQIKLRKIRLTCICIGLIGILALSIYSAYYILHKPPFVKDASLESLASIAPVHAPAPTATTIYTGMQRDRRGLSYSFTPKELLPSSPMSTTSMHIYQLSNASVHHIGGGGGGAAASGGSSSSTGQRGINATYTGAIYLTAMTAVTAVGASSATSMASTVTPDQGPNAAPGMRKTNSDPFDPFLDPVGDVAWPVMALLTLAYAYVIYRKRTRA